jgi:hypothetical protein
MQRQNGLDQIYIFSMVERERERKRVSEAPQQAKLCKIITKLDEIAQIISSKVGRRQQQQKL